MSLEHSKTDLAQREEQILRFWTENQIFQKSVALRKKAPRFVFYDGPPFATGLPHYGHILASTIKDVVPRYWTMRGFRVDRRWGWDCHGLPIENLVEEELKISGRRAIEKFGVQKFNQAARSKVLTYAAEWAKTIQRIGRFVDFENSYMTMHPTYMESVWWAFAELHRKGLVYEGKRTSLFCPRCETPLSNFEIAMDNSYREQEDDSVYVKLPIEGRRNEFLLVWTTTPWTLPGNAAVAVHPNTEYSKFKIKYEFLWAAVVPPTEKSEHPTVVEKKKGKALVGWRYVPPFRLSKDPNAYRVVAADFVDVAEGTGLVHIAPAFGEEDFELGGREKLPMIETLDDTGRFRTGLIGLAALGGKGAIESNRAVIEQLRREDLLWRLERITHRYPICWRCATPLIYKVQPAWFVKISAIKKKMLALNEKIDWHPEHLKHGRFGNGLETAPDWNVSRSRFWGTPIPIWECSTCKKIHVVGSRDEFHRRSNHQLKNRYFVMRHGEAVNNVQHIDFSGVEKKFPLTLRGRIQVERTARFLAKQKIDLIFSSPVWRALESARMVAKRIKIADVKVDSRLREIGFGVFEGKSSQEYIRFLPTIRERFYRASAGGENLVEVRQRMLEFLQSMEQEYRGKTILVVSHGDPLWMLLSGTLGLSNEEAIRWGNGTLETDRGYPHVGEIRGLNYRHIPRNATGEVDLHRPYVDEITLYCDCGGKMQRIPDVFDCWVESGSMPFAEKHYPFENKKLFEENFPADFIAEYIAQTRGWFYTLHVMSTGLFGKPAFKHVVTTGTILSEKGEKLSKSKQNFPDPWLLISRYGVDAMRYYLMSSGVMLADNLNFSEKEVDEVYKKYSLIISNVLNFFKLYRYRLKKSSARKPSPHVLDRWILSRLHSTIERVTKAYDSYEIVQATRPFLDFVQDLSLWYVRRSRERVKTDTPDAGYALRTLETVLFDFSRIMAPVTPFLAEMIYQDLGVGKKQSVHLEDWPKAEKKYIDRKLEERMVTVRSVVSEALRLRAEAGIRVRQPLANLQLTTHNLQRDHELLELVKEEVNVKEITFGKELRLDTKITPELKEEGVVREFVRNVQEMRKDLGLKPKQVIRLQIMGDQELETVLSGRQKMILKDTNAKELKIGGKKVFKAERELKLDGKSLWVGISI